MCLCISSQANHAIVSTGVEPGKFLDWRKEGNPVMNTFLAQENRRGKPSWKKGNFLVVCFAFMKFPPLKTAHLILGSAVAGATLAIAVAMAVIMMLSRHDPLADVLPLERVLLYARVRDAASLASVTEKAEIVWNLPPDVLPSVTEEGSFDFAVLADTGSGSNPGWILQRTSASGGVTVSASDAATEALLHEPSEARAFSTLPLWKHVGDRRENTVLLATASLPEEEEPLGASLRGLLMHASYAALSWDTAGKGTVFLPSPAPMKEGFAHDASASGTLLSAFASAPRALLTTVYEALRSADEGMAEGMRGIVTARLQGLLDDEEAPREAMLLADHPLSLLVSRGSGGRLNVSLSVAVPEGEERTQLREALRREAVRGGAVRTTDLLSGQRRTEIIAEEPVATETSSALFRPLPEGRTLTILTEGDGLILTTEENQTAFPASSVREKVLASGSVDLPWLRQTRDALFPFLIIPSQWPWSALQDITRLRWSAAYVQGMLELSYDMEAAAVE